MAVNSHVPDVSVYTALPFWYLPPLHPKCKTRVPNKKVMVACEQDQFLHTMSAVQRAGTQSDRCTGEPSTDKEFAPWAPAEDSPSAADYLRALLEGG